MRLMDHCSTKKDLMFALINNVFIFIVAEGFNGGGLNFKANNTNKITILISIRILLFIELKQQIKTDYFPKL